MNSIFQMKEGEILNIETMKSRNSLNSYLI
jgi:hypothetical protein